MKKTTSIITAVLVAGTILMSLQTASAQEWRVLIDKNIFTTDQLTQMIQKNSAERNDWLATQTPLMKNVPLTSANTRSYELKTQKFESEYSQVGSWAPLQADPGKENFTLFSF